MKKSLLKIIVCPDCKASLSCKTGKIEDSEIKEGVLSCGSCKKSYRIKNFIPRFVDSDEYVDNFSLEWQRHRSTQLDSKTGEDESTSHFQRITGFDLSKLKNSLFLDVGCGSGRYSDVVSNAGAQVIGIDLSFAVDAAYENIGKRKNVDIIQADVFRLPFKNETFDYIFSNGVLHHTPDCKVAFDQLPQLLKKGGQISIWVYSKKLHFLATDLIRIITSRMNREHLYGVCKTVVEPIYSLVRLPVVGHPFRIFISTHRNRDWRLLDTFDWYSPLYQSKHSFSEVVAWFKEAGLMKIEKLDFPTAVTGRKLEMEKQKILKAYKEKKITIRGAAAALGIDYWQMQELLEEAGLPVTDITDEEVKERKKKIMEMK